MNSADVQRNSVNITGFIFAVPMKTSRRCTFDEFESMAVAPLRQKHDYFLAHQ
jgi:hypothetical protein